MQKREHIELKLSPAEILDNGKVRIGALSPSFRDAVQHWGQGKRYAWIADRSERR